jgi:hypothetical protein
MRVHADNETDASQGVGLTTYQLRCLHQIASMLAELNIPLSKRLQGTLEILLNEISARQGSIMILDEAKSKLKVMASVNESLIGLEKDVEPKTITGYVCRTERPLLVKDIESDKRFKQRKEGYPTKSFLSVPLLSNQKGIIGVFHASDRENGGCFDESHLDLIIHYSLLLTPVLENALMMEQFYKGSERHDDVLQDLFSRQDDESSGNSYDLLNSIESYAKGRPQYLDLSDLHEESPPEEPLPSDSKKKKKGTYYLATNIFRHLARAKSQLREIAPAHCKSRITKSGIVNYSLAFMLHDLKKNRDKSFLARWFLDKDK